MMMYFIGAERWDLEQKLANLWWSSSFAGRIHGGHDDGGTRKTAHVSFGKILNILVFVRPTGKSYESLEGRVQKANKVLWTDAQVHRSKDVPWR